MRRAFTVFGELDVEDLADAYLGGLDPEQATTLQLYVAVTRLLYWSEFPHIHEVARQFDHAASELPSTPLTTRRRVASLSKPPRRQCHPLCPHRRLGFSGMVFTAERRRESDRTRVRDRKRRVFALTI
jgi:hypothetical protein